jgi:alpha-glucosidase
MLAGPLDYHQGGMRNVLPENYRYRDRAPPVQGTRGHQLAMFVVYQNPLPMMADYPAAYRGQPGLEFLVEVPTTWDETRVLHAEIGEYLVVARRRGDAWYLGGMTAARQRELDLLLDFLGEGSFEATMYLDDAATGPTSVRRREQTVAATDTIRVVMAAAGGFAIRLMRTTQ